MKEQIPEEWIESNRQKDFLYSTLTEVSEVLVDKDIAKAISNRKHSQSASFRQLYEKARPLFAPRLPDVIKRGVQLGRTKSTVLMLTNQDILDKMRVRTFNNEIGGVKIYSIYQLKGLFNGNCAIK